MSPLKKDTQSSANEFSVLSITVILSLDGVKDGMNLGLLILLNLSIYVILIRIANIIPSPMVSPGIWVTFATLILIITDSIILIIHS